LYEPGTCIQELKIICEARVPIEKVLPVFERWHQLRRLCLKIRAEKEPLAPLPVHRTIDFIQKMEHLTHLHLADEFVWQDALSILGKVNEVIAPNRPGFVLDLF
jgi:hypothetical protein